MTGDLETDHDVLVTLARFTLATAEQLHQLHGGQAGLKQTQKRLTRLHTEGLAGFITLPQAGRAKAWHLTAAGASATAAFPETRHPDGTSAAAAAEPDALRYGRSHFLNLGRIHCAFVTDARTRSEDCGPLDLTPAPEYRAEDGQVYRPAAELAYTANLDGTRLRLRAFVELHRPDTGTEPIAGQLAACARLWEQGGPDSTGRAWERLWKAFPRLLVVLVNTTAAEARTAVADLRLAAEERPVVAEMLAAVPTGAARIEDLIQRGPSAPIWHPLGAQAGRPCGWTDL
ncbi:replication-relaxation family protein [Streptomyces sp. SP17BM10]|uniref:replication-relaxation family protein n=1 Tax=Streptomyces sp. SP17BM10 TaxID=3002530 RepID=UPI002E78AD39|nr:replication-relaxation family protein [Streptomyces sp. SP17BM10]MEE1783018.1 replication-relaxation family protein [Streptomyces sp. SP17BM10]